MAICKLVVILGVVISLLHNGASRGFNGNYNQALMIQKASRITKRNTNDKEIVVRSKRSAAFHGSIRQQINSGNEDADCNDSEEDMPSKRLRRVPESPHLAKAIDNNIEDDNREVDDGDVNKRASTFISRFFSKYPQKDTQDEGDDDDNTNGADENSESGDNYIFRKVSSLFANFNVKDDNDDVKRSSPDTSNADVNEAVYSSAAELSQILKTAFATALEKSRVKRQTVEEVEHVDDHLRRAEMKDLFVAGHFANLGEPIYAGASSDIEKIAQETAIKKKMNVRRRRKRSGAKGYKAIMMHHGRTVNDIVHV